MLHTTYYLLGVVQCRFHERGGGTENIRGQGQIFISFRPKPLDLLFLKTLKFSGFVFVFFTDHKNIGWS